MLETITNYLNETGFGQFHWTNGVMILVGLLFIFLAIKKNFEPLLLVPIGFGILIGNVPYDASKLPLGVYDGPVSEEDLAYYEVDVADTDWRNSGLSDEQLAEAMAWRERTNDEVLGRLFHEQSWEFIPLQVVRKIDDPLEGQRLVSQNDAIVVNTHQFLTPKFSPHWAGEFAPAIYHAGNGRHVAALEPTGDGRYPVLWSLEKQDPTNASVFWWLFAGVGLAGFYPPLIFLGVGALTDFGPMLSNPKTLFLGAAAQFGIFGSLLAAIVLGFTLPEAASIGIIGGADGPTAIFTCAQLAPDLLGPVALAAYSYMALVPIIQPPIIKLLTSPEERKIRMAQPKEVSQAVKVVFPIAGFLLTAFIAPGGLPLLGMLFFGNLLRESLVTTRLMKTAQGPFIDIVTILLGVTVGAKTAASSFLTLQTIYIFAIGIAAFAIATATGVLFGKAMNAISKSTGGDPVNPMIGAAGVSAVPMAARVVHKMGQDEDPQNFLLMHAMGPNVAGVIGSAVAAGVLLSKLGGG
ncbi:MAG: sodium ion-translocating decarboxylase subunit beta [Planctomycetota bacterium]